MATMDELFGKVIYAYTRAQALEDGELVDLVAVAPEVCRQHCGNTSVACTAAVFAILERAEKNGRWMNDWNGLVHDLLWMAGFRHLRRWIEQGEAQRLFQVVIRGAGRKSVYTFRLHIGPGDHGETVVTLMLPEES